VRQLFKAGIAIDAIARRLRMSVNTIRAILELGQPIPSETAARIRELHAAGVSKEQIAKQLKVNSRAVYRILPPVRDLTRAAPTAASVPARRRMPRRRALTIKAFAEQHRLDIEDVRAAISESTIGTFAIGKTMLIPDTESARLLREAYLELSIKRAAPAGVQRTARVAGPPGPPVSNAPSNGGSAGRRQ
jgi:plasmid maintenance system antidote protein VapI